MKKQEAIDLGRQDGKAAFERVNPFIDANTTPTQLLELARNSGIIPVKAPKAVQDVYEDAFLKAFVGTGMTIYHELPEVKQEARWRSAQRWVQNHSDRSSLKGLAAALADTDQDPAYAMSWSDRAFKEAAFVSVAAKVNAILTEEEPKTKADGTEITRDDRLAYAREFALREAMREARWPSSSTSTVSNLMARYVASAWAEFYEDTKYGW